MCQDNEGGTLDAEGTIRAARGCALGAKMEVEGTRCCTYTRSCGGSEFAPEGSIVEGHHGDTIIGCCSRTEKCCKLRCRRLLYSRSIGRQATGMHVCVCVCMRARPIMEGKGEKGRPLSETMASVRRHHSPLETQRHRQ